MKRFNIPHFKKFLSNKGGFFSQKGIALPVVLMVVGGLSLAGAAAVGIATGEVGISRNDNGYKTAFNIAEAGIADATDAIGGNSTLLPRPLGGIASDSAQFSVQYNLPGTNGTGRYIITMSLPVVTQVTTGNGGGTTNLITVGNSSSFAPSETVLIGSSTVHMTAVIQTISGNQLTLQGSNGLPFTKNIDTTMFVAKNLINVLAEGQYGSGLQANYPNTSWRTAMSGAAMNFLTFSQPLPAGGSVRSSATILSQYNVQSIPIFDSFEANVQNPGSTFNGPLLVTGQLSVSPYTPGSYTGPIFAVNPSQVSFTPGPGPTVIAVPNTVVTASGIVSSAAANVQCYQTACSATAPAQIYSVNGYQMRVYTEKNASTGAVVSSEQQMTNPNNVFNTLTKNLPAINANFTGQATDKQNFNGGAVLFGGKLINQFSNSDIGRWQAYDTTYYIHTSDNLHPTTDACGESDIIIVARTIVTYMGQRTVKTSNTCTNPQQMYSFQYETIWNHYLSPVTNFANSGLQADDAEALLHLLPHKGYYKWVRMSDGTDSEPVQPVVTIGDQEFNSVFNHSAKTNFHSAIVNWNISRVNLVGFSNPPATANASNVNTQLFNTPMVVAPKPFPTSTWFPSGQKQGISNNEVSGNYSSFGISPATNGFDFSTIGFIFYRDQNNYPYIIDAATITPGANTFLYVGNQTTSNINNGTLWSYTNNPGANNADPLYPQPPLLSPTQTVITATNSGPATAFVITRGMAGLFFDPANSIAFNVASIKVETTDYGAPISIGSAANPATVVTQSLNVESEGCGAYTAWNFTGSLVAHSVEFEDNVKYTQNSNLSAASACLTSGVNYVFLQRVNWKEIRK